MQIAETLLQVLATALHIWDTKTPDFKTRLIEKKADIERRYRAELAKDAATRSDAVLDNLLFELRELSAEFCAACAGAADAPHQP